MSRMYDRTGASAPTFRERPQVMRHVAHVDRDAEIERAPLRAELDPMKVINPTNLDAPEPRPGYVQRWISDQGADGTVSKEWARKMKQGWSPRDPSTISDHQRRIYETSKTQSGDGAIRMAGLVLCEIPRNVAMERKHAVDELIRRQRASVHPSAANLKNGEARKAGVAGELTITDDTRVMRGRRAATMIE